MKDDVAGPPDPVGATTPHSPLRPIWCCRACGHPWPCARARLHLTAEYADTLVTLSVYLCGLLHEAVGDLYRLNPADGPSPQAMFDRFLGWVPHRHRPG
ncbi:hypothetical protein [Micromonospora echinofusca]|uniref:Flavin reductase n=1 Tax=Micromonospora echinofusca TaxID=47858 RepID=A0ABS3VWE5_MICEH|nr:hypothetical protein [Micromonospora echinofusca]MBO4208850.1 hypothetical protein [Micromonospora echinofusca]